MENNQCPYCGGKLIKGNIFGERYSLKWVPKEDKLIMGIWVKSNYIPIGSGGIFGKRPRVATDYCKKCNKMIIDLN